MVNTMGILSGVSVLPVVPSLPYSGSFPATVAPYLSQLTELPEAIYKAGFDLDKLQTLYVSTNPVITALALSLFLAPIFLIVSEVNRNYSQVDRCWSLLPTVYNGHYCLWAHLAGLPTRRLDHIVAFSCLWSLRLSYNYYRKGGYNIGSEDYRWEVLRQKISPVLFFIFNVAFISLAQSVLLFLITTPTYVLLLAARITGDTLSTADLVFSRGLIGLVVVTWFADQQQWNYHQAKLSYQRTAKPPPKYSQASLDRGFCTSGLWGWSRHPNFAAEQAIWVTLYEWSCYETNAYYNWTGIGALSYLILFQGSTWFTELITSGKYPEYKDYQQRVSKFLPKITAAWTAPVLEAPPLRKVVDKMNKP